MSSGVLDRDVVRKVGFLGVRVTAHPYGQAGSGVGKEVLYKLSSQQLPVPEKSQIKSLGGNGASLGSGLRPFNMTTFSRILLLSGKGLMRGSNAATAGGS